MKKKIIVLVLIGSMCSFSEPKETGNTLSQSADFSWLLGFWKRVNDKEGMQTYEHWKKIRRDLYKGHGCTIQKGDTVWQEAITLKKVQQGWHFEVQGKGESNPTIFKIKRIGDSEFSCENQENEFPKVIHYSASDSGLKAVISGGDRQVDFDFIKIDN